MCWQVWACVSVDVCQSSSVNIVLCSSNNSSFCSAVAARSTVYFPSWRTTSYQISRHCFQARCPTTRSQRISRPLSCWPSASPWRLTAIWTTHISLHTEVLVETAVISAKMSPSPSWARICSVVHGEQQLTQASILHRLSLGAAAMLHPARIYRMSSEIHSYTEQMWQMTQCFFPCCHGSPRSYDREISTDGGSHHGGFMTQCGPREALHLN